MILSSLAGLPAPREILIDPAQVEHEYYARKPNPADRAQIAALPSRDPSKRPSGIEEIYKIYAESFKDERHLSALVAEAQRMVASALASRSSSARKPRTCVTGKLTASIALAS
jgi:hypothetical protein